MLNRKRVFNDDEDSQILSHTDGKKHRKMADTSVKAICPPQLHEEVIEIDESDEEKDIVGGGVTTGRSQLPVSFSVGKQSRRALLKTEIAKLCKALKLSEDIVHLVQRLLEYLVKNYDVNKGNTHQLCAFQISLCWIAGDILGKKIDRKDSLVEAVKIPNFQCPEDVANSVYQKLTLKETFLQFHGKTNDSISPRNVVSPLADIAVSLSNLQEPCVKGEADLKENQEARDKIDAAKKREKLRKLHKLRKLSKLDKFRKLHKHCKKLRLKLRQEHEKTAQEFEKIRNEKIEKLLAEKSDILKKNKIISQTKLSKLLAELGEGFQDFEMPMLRQRDEMKKKQAAEMEELQRKCENFLARAAARYGSGGSTMINDSNANDGTTGAPPITIASDIMILDASTVETEIVNEVASTIGDTKGYLVSLGSHSGGSLPEDAPSTVGTDPADCLKPVDPQSANACDNGTTEEPNTAVSPHEHSTDLQEASISGTHIIMDPADCDGCPDSHTAEEVDKIRRAGDHTHNLVGPAQVDENVSVVYKQPVLENGEDGVPLSSDNATDKVDSHDSLHDSDTAGEPDEIRAGEESAGAQAQNLVSPIQVDESVTQLHKQSVLQNGEDSVGQLHEPADASELQNADVLSNQSCLVSVEADSHVHHDLPPVSGGIDHESNGEHFSGLQIPNSILLTPHPQLAWQTTQLLLGEPLQTEYTKRCNEKEQLNKLHEDTNSQLKAACEKDIQEMYDQIRDKYTTKLRDAESSCNVKKTELEAMHNKLVMNKLLANAFRCHYLISSRSSNVIQPGAPSGLLHQQQFVSSSRSCLRRSHVASSSPLSQHATVNPVYSGQRQPGVSLASSQPATIQQTNNTPNAQFTPRPLNPSLTHSRLPQISTVTPTLASARGRGSFVRAPAPHIQPFLRTPSSSQPARLGIDPNHPNAVQPGPPRNPPSFSSVDLPNRQVPVSNKQALSGVEASNVVCLSDDDDDIRMT